MALICQLFTKRLAQRGKKTHDRIIKMDAAKHYLALWSCPSAPWRPGQRSAPGHMPGPGVSDGTWQLAPPAVGICLQMGWEQRLGRSKKDIIHLKKHDLSTISRVIEHSGEIWPRIEMSFHLFQ